MARTPSSFPYALDLPPDTAVSDGDGTSTLSGTSAGSVADVMAAVRAAVAAAGYVESGYENEVRSARVTFFTGQVVGVAVVSVWPCSRERALLTLGVR